MRNILALLLLPVVFALGIAAGNKSTHNNFDCKKIEVEQVQTEGGEV